METLRDRLVEIMDAIGNDAELARKAGVSRASVSDWRAGNIRSLKALTALNIQEKTGYSARWLILGIGPKKFASKSELREMSALEHNSSPKLSRENEQKLLAVLRSFLDTDDEGKAQIVEAVEAITGANGQQRRRTNRVHKRRGGGVNP